MTSQAPKTEFVVFDSIRSQAMKRDREEPLGREAAATYLQSSGLPTESTNSSTHLNRGPNQWKQEENWTPILNESSTPIRRVTAPPPRPSRLQVEPHAYPSFHQSYAVERSGSPQSWSGYLAGGVPSPRETPPMADIKIDDHQQLHEHRRHSTPHLASLISHISRLELEPRQARGQLEADQTSPLLTEATKDVWGLQQKLVNINKVVDHFVYNMLHNIIDEFGLGLEGAAALNQSTVNAAMVAVQARENTLLALFNRHAWETQMTVGRYIQAVSRALLLHFLMSYVFAPLVPRESLALEDSRPANRILGRNLTAEPRGISSGQRNSTAYAKRDDDLTATTCTRSFLTAICPILYRLIPRLRVDSLGPLDITWMKPFEPTLHAIVKEAIKWQDARESHPSFKYMVMFITGGKYDNRSMVRRKEDALGNAGQKLNVILCVGLGLLEVRESQEGEPKMRRQQRIINPAKVIAIPVANT